MNPSQAFAALSDPINLQILSLLKQPEKYFPLVKLPDIYRFGVCFHSLEKKMNLSQTRLSHHLRTLHTAELITINYVGRLPCYKRNEKNIVALGKFITNIAEQVPLAYQRE